MNEYEAERIAAAINVLRPDWPTRSLITLMQRPGLANKPRRDVAVAFAWIACEANTAKPARVLEAGPWWQAAAIEGGYKRVHPPKKADECPQHPGQFADNCATCITEATFADYDDTTEVGRMTRDAALVAARKAVRA